MAEALCGPSNALQTFQKHTSVDRSLQHDRLDIRSQRTQGFRSSPGLNSPSLDADFRSFQSDSLLGGHANPPLQRTQVSQFSQAASSTAFPSWAADFQQLNLNEPNLAGYSRPFPAASTQGVPTARGWHQEFLDHQQPSVLNHGSPYYDLAGDGASQQYTSHNAIGRGYSSVLPQTQPMLQHDQRPQSSETFDDTAFAQAFDAAQAELEQESSTSKEKGKEPVNEPLSFDLSHACTDPGDVVGDYDFDAVRDNVGDVSRMVDELRKMREDAGWGAVEAYERAYENELEQTNSQKSRELVDAIRSMRAEEEAGLKDTDQLHTRIGADTIPAYDDQNPNLVAEADALARTAGELLHNLKEEQSDKFAQSNFMELMRQLRDREVRVEGDKMVNVAQEPHPGGEFYPYDAFQASI